jgi:hypothetical protein
VIGGAAEADGPCAVLGIVGLAMFGRSRILEVRQKLSQVARVISPELVPPLPNLPCVRCLAAPTD